MTPTGPVRIVAFGDSITHAGHQEPADRWPAILDRELRKRFPQHQLPVINSGVGGNTSREGLARFDRDVLAHQPHLVLVEFGNDATYVPERHVPVAEFKDNPRQMHDRLRNEVGGRLLLLTFPPIIDEWHREYDALPYRERGGQNACQEVYRQATRDLAAELGLPLIDIDGELRAAMAENGPESCILTDGVHLTAEANCRVAAAVAAVLIIQLERWLELQ